MSNRKRILLQLSENHCFELVFFCCPVGWRVYTSQPACRRVLHQPTCLSSCSAPANLQHRQDKSRPEQKIDRLSQATGRNLLTVDGDEELVRTWSISTSRTKMESALTQIAMGEDGEVWFLLLLDVLDVLFYHNIFLIIFFLLYLSFRLGTPRCERVRPVRLVRPLT